MSRTFVHVEIPADDVARAQAFYEALFGWKIAPVEGFEGYNSVMVSDNEDDLHGALMQREHEEHRFVTYISTPSVDESLAKLESLGGTMVVPKMPVPGMGWFAQFRDPEGNVFGLWEEDPSAA